MKTMRFSFHFFPALLLLGSLAGCAVQSDSGHAPFRERSDSTIRGNLVGLWQKTNPAFISDLTVKVGDGVVTVDGTVNSEQERITALENVWDTEGVREVVNQIKLAGSANKNQMKDNETAVKLRTRLTFDPQISSTDYSIEVLGNTVYLIGRAQTQDELDRVVNYANGMPAIEKVVVYVKTRA